MTGHLEGRTAIVTGAGSGIGRATARLLAARGAHVVVNDLAADRARETVAQVHADGGSAEERAGDVTRSDFVDGLVDEVVARRGRLDILHSNAGAGLAQGPLASVDDAGWHAEIALNLDANFFCVRAALRVMAPARHGSIIVTASGAGLAAVPGAGAYGTAKAGVLQLVRSAAVEYGPAGVRVNAVVPGAVASPRFTGRIGGDERLARYERQIPLGRTSTAQDVAEAVLWLASDASANVTGIALPVDGGASARLAQPYLGD
ncbi:SDR family NAD(P)-dependent oxidoreductase [Frankia sp. Cppng1_Ct_nod]|uniref:SDR family NAD(P)-dependent oxidoreductase n=1 Tax=Frankia sp. Cppng1_Ct_nod TaxID=2897162 RepID=UPI0010412AA6|nr:SDR family NAD(P)-dependent oxidoreductase [Frankia sp. Cppng1_Ct_nod]